MEQSKCVAMDKWAKYGTYKCKWILFHIKESNPIICQNMEGHWGHYAKWTGSDKERQILYNLTYMHNLKKTH